MLASVSRRQFLRASAIAAAGPLLLSRPMRAEANDRIQLGCIGVGTMGRGHLGSFLGRNEVQVVAVCDVVEERRESARKMVEDRYSSDKKANSKGCKAFNDFPELLALKEVDAV